MGQFDAYKQCRVHRDDLWQQVYKAGGKFYIDLGGIFGSVNAGDAWNLVMELIISSMRASVSWELIFYYVDNAIVLTPPISDDGPDKVGAGKVFSRVVAFLDQAAVPYHQVVPPTTRTKFLGWIFDTDLMTVEICPERRAWMREQMEEIKSRSRPLSQWWAYWSFCRA